MLNQSQIKQLVEEVCLQFTGKPFFSIALTQKDYHKTTYFSKLKQLVYDFGTNSILEESDPDYEGEQYFVFDFKDQLYRVEYEYTSYGGVDYDNAEIFTVTKKVETIVTYQRDPSIRDMNLVHLNCRADTIQDIHGVKAAFDNTQNQYTLKSGVVVNEQQIANFNSLKQPIKGGYLIFLLNQWLYFDPEYGDVLEY